MSNKQCDFNKIAPLKREVSDGLFQQQKFTSTKTVEWMISVVEIYVYVLVLVSTIAYQNVHNLFSKHDGASTVKCRQTATAYEYCRMISVVLVPVVMSVVESENSLRKTNVRVQYSKIQSNN